jgi:succinoglycan biosynthesis protein ExoU
VSAPVCVIIPAFNAAATIGQTIRSVLAEPEVGEVVVVDDASRDATVETARAADDHSGRLVIHRQETNGGPSQARNRAIAESSRPLLAIVDADDMVVPGRFGHLLGTARGNWDFLADNIVFIPEDAIGDATGLAVDQPTECPSRRLGLEQFVLGNIPEPNRPRAELGFLKPVFRREFLEANCLSYDPTLRLGEDFVLYARALLHGARFVVAASCGYIAIQRSHSLSGSHRTADLEALLVASERLDAEARLRGMTGGMLAILERHRAGLRDKVALRRLLDNAREMGRLRALAGALPEPRQLSRSALALRRDRLSAAHEPVGRRLLLGPDFFSA